MSGFFINIIFCIQYINNEKVCVCNGSFFIAKLYFSKLFLKSIYLNNIHQIHVLMCLIYIYIYIYIANYKCFVTSRFCIYKYLIGTKSIYVE